MKLVKNIAISSGHGKYVAGASKYIKEHDEARKVVDKVSEYLKELGCTVHKFHDNTSKTANTNLSTIVKYHNSKSRELDVSVHFNAGGGTGTEVFYYSEKALSAKVSKAVSLALGLRDRGAKLRKELYFLRNTTKPAILIEVCFVDTKADADAYKKNFDKMCKAIAETLAGKKLPQPKPKQESKTAPKTDNNTFYRVIAGSYNDRKNAENMMKKLKDKGFNSFIDVYKK